jgi:hypothetical protein
MGDADEAELAEDRFLVAALPALADRLGERSIDS